MSGLSRYPNTLAYAAPNSVTEDTRVDSEGRRYVMRDGKKYFVFDLNARMRQDSSADAVWPVPVTADAILASAKPRPIERVSSLRWVAFVCAILLGAATGAALERVVLVEMVGE